jgi:hypothetical protein
MAAHDALDRASIGDVRFHKRYALDPGTVAELKRVEYDDLATLRDERTCRV